MLVRRHASRVALSVAALAVTMFTTSGAFAEPAVTVLYAGSLVGLMERSVGPAFKQQTGEEFRGHAGGSQELAKKVKEGALQGDVFISADPKVNALLSGPTNEDRVKWYVTFAESPLVLGISPSGRFAVDTKGKPWNEILMQPGVKIGRTDPAKDPKGALPVEFLKKADKPELAKKLVLDHSSVLAGRNARAEDLMLLTARPTMRGLGLGIAIFLAGMRLSSAVEGQIDARTLCNQRVSTVKMRRRCRNFSASSRTFSMIAAMRPGQT